MKRARALNHLWARVGLAIVTTVALAVLLAAPALADPAATNWTISPKSKIVTYGQALLLSGTLKSDGTGLPGRWVDFGQATTSSGSYEIIYKITTPLAAESTKYEVAVIPKQTMYYRFQWAGDATYAAGNSGTIPVQVMPALGAPGNGTTITVGKKFSIKGSVTPGPPAVRP